jgi:FdrA protein
VRGKRVVASFVGWDGGEAPFDVYPTLEAGACAAAEAAPSRDDEPELDGGGELLGLFSGGSLAYEAQTILGPGHRILDLGEEEYTQGRPHPMVDLELRRRMLREEGPKAGCVLLDVVLGHGAHPDPAGELAETLEALTCPVIAHVCGTKNDPQDAERQAATLREAGVHVAPTNAAAARLAKRVVS